MSYNNGWVYDASSTCRLLHGERVLGAGEPLDARAPGDAVLAAACLNPRGSWRGVVALWLLERRGLFILRLLLRFQSRHRRRVALALALQRAGPYLCSRDRLGSHRLR